MRALRKNAMLFCLMTALCGWATGYAAPQESAPAQVEQDDAQKFVPGQDIPLAWWELFQSPQIDHLLKRAIKTHPDMETAQAALQQVQEYAAVYRGFFYPSVAVSDLPSSDAAAGNSGNNEPESKDIQADANPAGSKNNAPAYYNLHIEGLTVGYVPEVLALKSGEQGADQVETQQMQLQATYKTLASNVVAAAIQQAMLRAQIEAQLKIVSLNQHALEIVRNQLKLGYVTEKEVTQQEMTSALAQQGLTPLQEQLEQTRNLLLVLAGPDEDAEGTDLTERDVEDVFSLDSLHLLQDLPLSLPSRLVEQRPDVRIAEARLRSVSAQYGIAIAHMMPQFAITAAKGGMATSPAWMVRNGGDFFLNGEVTHFVFDKRKLRTKSFDAKQALAQSAAQYRNVVMVALQNLADTLQVIQSDDHAFKAAEKAEQIASKLGDQTREEYQAGSVDFQNLLVVQQNQQLATIKLIQAQSTRLGDTVALLHALGGGWWNHGMIARTAAKHP